MSDLTIEALLRIAFSVAVLGVVVWIAARLTMRRTPERTSVAPAAPANASAPRTALEARAAAIAETPAGQCDVIDCSEAATHPGTHVERVRGGWDWLIERLGGTAPATYRIHRDTKPSKCVGHAVLCFAKDSVWISARLGRAATAAEEEARALHEHNAVERYDALCADQAAALAKAKRPKRPATNVVPIRAADGGAASE